MSKPIDLCTGEFSVQTARYRLINVMGFLGRLEATKAVTSSLLGNCYVPALSAKGHTFEPIAARGLIGILLTTGGESKVRNAVVASIQIRMVEISLRPLSIDIKPRQPVSAINFSGDEDFYVTGILVAKAPPSFSAEEFSCFRAIGTAIAKRLGVKHGQPPLAGESFAGSREHPLQVMAPVPDQPLVISEPARDRRDGLARFVSGAHLLDLDEGDGAGAARRDQARDALRPALVHRPVDRAIRVAGGEDGGHLGGAGRVGLFALRLDQAITQSRIGFDRRVRTLPGLDGADQTDAHPRFDRNLTDR